MSKFQLLLLLAVALAATACARNSWQGTADRPAADQLEPAMSQDLPMIENQEPTSDSEENPAPSENTGTAPPVTEAPAPTATNALAPLPVIALAPNWNNDTWINTDTPMPLEDLRGKVVLLEFWTFG